MPGVKFTKAQLAGTKMADNLFTGQGKYVPEQSQADKVRSSRKKTNEFQKWVVDFLNDSKQFKVWRNNNLPSTRLAREKKLIKGVDKRGIEVEVTAEIPVVHFKKNQITVSTFDIIGFRIEDGKHLEIEIKVGKDTLDKDQKTHMSDLQSSSCISFATGDKETFKAQIKPFMTERKLAF